MLNSGDKTMCLKDAQVSCFFYQHASNWSVNKI